MNLCRPCSLSVSTSKYADNSILGENLAKQVPMRSNQLIMLDRNGNQVCDTDTKKLSLNSDRTRMEYSNTKANVDIHCSLEERILSCFGYLKKDKEAFKYEASETLGEKLTERICFGDKCSIQNIDLSAVHSEEERTKYKGFNSYEIKDGKELYLNKFINNIVDDIELVAPSVTAPDTAEEIITNNPTATQNSNLNSNQTESENCFYNNIDSVVPISLSVTAGIGLGLTSAYCVYRTFQAAKQCLNEYRNSKLSTEDKVKSAAPAILWGIGSLAATVSCSFIATR